MLITALHTFEEWLGDVSILSNIYWTCVSSVPLKFYLLSQDEMTTAVVYRRKLDPPSAVTWSSSSLENDSTFMSAEDTSYNSQLQKLHKIYSCWVQ